MGEARYESLDIWRGVACLAVVVFHATRYLADEPPAGAIARAVVAATSRLEIGVPLFFVISGYCISASMEAGSWTEGGARAFLWKRLRRIYPPYWVFLACALGAWAIGEAWIGPDDHHPNGDPAELALPQWIGSITLIEPWRPSLVGPPPTWFWRHAWTLAYEEQFYLVMALSIALAPGRPFVVPFAATVATAACRLFVPSDAIAGTFLNGAWLHFFAGVVVYLARRHATRRRARLALAAMIACCALAGFRHATSAGVDQTWLHGAESMGAAALLLVLSPWDAALARVRALLPLAACGRRCYSVYLVHYPIAVAVSRAAWRAGVRGVGETMLLVVPAAVAVTLAAAWVFHDLVERRFMSSPAASRALA